MRTGESHPPAETGENHRSVAAAEGRPAGLTPLTPSNTPQTPTSGRESPNTDLQSTIDRIQSLQLDRDALDDTTTRYLNDNGQQRSEDNGEVSYGNRYNFRYRSTD